MRRPLRWGAPVVAGHFLVVLWHLGLLVKVQPETPGFLPPLLIAINLLPVAGLLTFAKGFPRLAGILITVPLGTAFVIGAYSHFLSSGSDNVLHMAPRGMTFWFQASAVLLAVLEGLGCAAGIQMLLLGIKKARAIV